MSEIASETEGETITIHGVLRRGARTGLELQSNDGSFPQRESSYYGDPQLPVRTTSQWLRVFTTAYSISNDRKYLEAAHDAASYLISDSGRPHGFSFHCRNSSGKDHCNGVYGQAMPVWALTTAAESLGRTELRDVAADVVMQHPYDGHLSLWNRLEIDGDILTIDRTLNHQLAFAGAVSTIDSDHCRATIQDFLDNLERLIGTRSDGIIRHFARTPFVHTGESTPRNRLVTLRNRVLFEIYRYSPSFRQKEVSYQATNLFWLAYLKKQRPEHAFWRSELVNQIVSVVKTEEFKKAVRRTDMAFTASPTGFYVAVALAVLDDDESEAVDWIEEQLARSYDLSGKQVIGDVSDRIKMASNICYLAEFPNLEAEVTVRDSY